MPQTVLSVVLEVQPQSAAHLTGVARSLSAGADTNPRGAERHGKLRALVPMLHFMSVTVFEDGQYDPLLVIEVNCDGLPGPFWAQLEAVYGSLLRDLVRCCKRPSDERGILFDKITVSESRRPVAPYLEAMTVRPMVFHQGNRGLDRDHVLRDAELFLETRRVLAHAGGPVHGAGEAKQMHGALRAALLPKFPWLEEPSATRITMTGKVADLIRFLAFLGVMVFCLSIPGLVVASFSHPVWMTAIFAMLGLVAGVMVCRLWAPLAGQGAPRETGGLTLSRKRKITSLGHPVGFIIALAAFLVLYSVLASMVLSVLVWPLTGTRFGPVWHGTLRAVALSLVSVPFSALALMWWLRRLERRDASQDAPPVAVDRLRAFARNEDYFVQNHMGSMVLVKPGVLRTLLILAGLRGLGLVVRVVARDGYLGSMRTIHFAHWALVNNNSRLIFFSNFDGSWESYLDDFIEKAHGGLSLAWGNCVGFPPGRFLIMDGASHGRRFKAWARHSMTVTLFWYSAYPGLTVNQIERQATIADGLRRANLSPAEAAKWIRHL